MEIYQHLYWGGYPEVVNSKDVEKKQRWLYNYKNTYLEKLFNEHFYSDISLDYYLEELAYVITHVSPSLVIHRISGDAPKDLLVAPDWNKHKKWILNGIYKRLNNNKLGLIKAETILI